jgi:ATPase subunit of ABC transporter with duplicated ATPase domains
MILDEPTNHLDQAMISDLLSRLEKLPYQPAVLLISHDNQALSLADQVYRFQEGVLHPE